MSSVSLGFVGLLGWDFGASMTLNLVRRALFADAYVQTDKNGLPVSRQTIRSFWCLTATYSLSSRHEASICPSSAPLNELLPTTSFLAFSDRENHHPLCDSSCNTLQQYIHAHEYLWEEYPAT